MDAEPHQKSLSISFEASTKMPQSPERLGELLSIQFTDLTYDHLQTLEPHLRQFLQTYAFTEDSWEDAMLKKLPWECCAPNTLRVGRSPAEYESVEEYYQRGPRDFSLLLKGFMDFFNEHVLREPVTGTAKLPASLLERVTEERTHEHISGMVQEQQYVCWCTCGTPPIMSSPTLPPPTDALQHVFGVDWRTDDPRQAADREVYREAALKYEQEMGAFICELMQSLVESLTKDPSAIERYVNACKKATWGDGLHVELHLVPEFSCWFQKSDTRNVVKIDMLNGGTQMHVQRSDGIAAYYVLPDPSHLPRCREFRAVANIVLVEAPRVPDDMDDPRYTLILDAKPGWRITISELDAAREGVDLVAAPLNE